MLLVGQAVIEDDVLQSEFCCAPEVCKGACCSLEGGRGAPLEDDEILEVQRAFPAARRYLHGRHLESIERVGLWEGSAGDYVTPCVENRACVFVYFDGEVARCSFERAFLEGLTKWRKPLSCHLFPIRLSGWGKDHVRYERIHECEGGRRRGERDRVPLADFLKEPLIRAYGIRWYRQLVSQSPLKERGKKSS